MFRIGDRVNIEESAQFDVGFQAWSFVKAHPSATVRACIGDEHTPESQVMCALEWESEFSGGIDCQGTCAPRRGQYVMAAHLSLDFEGSRVANTVPHVAVVTR